MGNSDKLKGYHGLVKTMVANVYYYQDELGSTSHIASATGALIESYQYDLYGKPRVYNPGGTYQPNATPVAKDLGNGGSRWISELGLYDDRNRFMSPDLGRFLQPDPIGFKGDASNLYRYCGNDWANRTDLMGLLDGGINTILDPKWMQAQRDQDRKEIAHFQGIINQKISLGYGATQLAGLYHSMNKLQQSMDASSVSVTGQATASHGTQNRQSRSTGTPTSFRILEGQTINHGTWKYYEYQAYANGKPVFNNSYEMKEVFTEMYSKHVDFHQTTDFRPLDKNGRWGDNVGFHFEQRQPPRWAMDIREQRFYARRIGDQGPGTLMNSQFIHMSFLHEGRANNEVFDVSSHVEEH